MSYKGIVATIEAVQKHPNADKLALATVLDTQIVVGTDTKAGDIGVYFPSDGQLSHEFLMKNNLYRKNPETNEKMGGYFEENRRVRIQKFRGQISDGIFVPLSYFAYAGKFDFQQGVMFDEINGHPICNKYVRKIANTPGAPGSYKGKVNRESLYPYFYKVGDTPKFVFYINQLRNKDVMIVTEKLHGTSGRTGYMPKELKKNWADKILSKFGYERTKQYEYVTGTRNTILEENPYHTKDNYRLEAHEFFKNKLVKGETIYYEIVGPGIMPSHNNTILTKQDQEKYGSVMQYNYGVPQGQHKIYVYRMTMINEDGYAVEYSWSKLVRRCKEIGVQTVPVLDVMLYYGANKQTELDYIKEYLDGPSTLDSSHIREGVVIRVNDDVYKYKGATFCLLEDINKDEYIDPEDTV